MVEVGCHEAALLAGVRGWPGMLLGLRLLLTAGGCVDPCLPQSRMGACGGVRGPEDTSSERYLFRDAHGGYGYVNRWGEVVLPAKYEVACRFEDGMACVAFCGRTDPDEYVVIDTNGKALKRLRSSEFPRYGDGMFRVSSGIVPSCRYGFVSCVFLGFKDIEPLYVRAGAFHCGLAVVAWPESDGSGYVEYAFIDYYGHERFSGRCQEARSFQGGRAWIKSAGKWRIIDTEGRFVGSVAVDMGRGFSEGLAAAFAQGSWGYIGEDGNWVLTPQYEEAEEFSEGLALVRKKGSGNVFIDRSGRVAISQSGFYDISFANRFSEGLAFVRRCGRDGKTVGAGFMNRKGELAISLEGCDLAGDFVRGLCPVRIHGRVVYIDRTPKVALTPPPGCKFVHWFPEEG